MNQKRKGPAEDRALSRRKYSTSFANALYNKNRAHSRGSESAADLKSRINAAIFYSTELGHELPDKQGQWVSRLCPFHSDTRPSLRILLPDGAFRCMACGARGGDIIAFTQKKYQMRFPAALEYLARVYGGSSP